MVAALFSATASLAQTGIKGKITIEDGSPLPFATIFVRQIGTGTTANVDGQFEILVPNGRYDLVFQHLGRKSVERVVIVENKMTELNVTLEIQEIVLQTVTVGEDDEDAAYSIMRKAIGKANYHRNFLDSYSARVYIKGAGKLKDYPWLAKKALQKEGIEKGRVFISESVSDIKFTRPGKFEEKVISIRSDGKDNNTSPNSYIFGSFYEPEIAETVSPLSPKAFSYYKFEYLGTFPDRNYEVSRIKVTPRSKGDNVVEGVIYIVENDWSIHSLELKTTKLGISIGMKVMCAPIEDKAWLPVSHQFKVDGKVLGFEFEYNYLSTVSNYKIAINPKVYVENMQVVDARKEKELAKELEQKQKQATAKAKKNGQDLKQLEAKLSEGGEITNKQLKAVMREYEKEERKNQKEPEVIGEYNFKIDSGAYKKDSAYWSELRPVPLTLEEIKGYQKSDSLAAIERAKEQGDTLKESKHKGFQPWDILLGDYYKISKHSNFQIYAPFGGFNTVEGANIIYKVAFGTILQDTNKTRFVIRPIFRYAFAREKVSGYLNVFLSNKNYRLEVNGGRYIAQFNNQDPILPIVNTFTTLFLEQNLMKIYERDFTDIKYRLRVNPFVTLNASLSWQDRKFLQNTTRYKLVNRKSIEDYTPNAPMNEELVNTVFPDHQAVTGTFSVQARPWLKFRIRNGRKYELGGSSPVLSLSYRKGFNSILGSDVDYDNIQVGFRHDIRLGVRGNLDVYMAAGTFLRNDKMYFPDYQHFLGNRTPFSTNDPVGSFRLLDYYQFSTAKDYLASNVHYQFRKFLVTTIPYVRLMGIRENIFVNYLATPSSGNYTEVGYSIDGILRIFRLEGAASFINGRYLDYGFRIGIASNITVNFSD